MVFYVRAGLEKHFCISETGSKAEQVVRFIKFVDSTLILFVIGKEDLQDQFVDHLIYWTEATKVKDRPPSSLHMMYTPSTMSPVV